MSAEQSHQLIREMEKAGCEFTFRVSTISSDYLLMVNYQGERFMVTADSRFDFEEAYRMWCEKVDHSLEATVSPRTRRRARTRVVTPLKAPEPHKPENPAPEADESQTLSLKERLKLRNQERVAS